MKALKLTSKQSAFCDEYLVDLNASAAARRAGYSPKTAFRIGQENMQKLACTNRISELKAERCERVKIDADWVLKHNADILAADIADILDDNGGYLPIKTWPLIWRQMLSGVDVQEIFEGFGKDREKVGEVVKIKLIDRLKALEMIGKHVNVQAFSEKQVIEHTGSISTNEVSHADMTIIRQLKKAQAASVTH